MDWRSQDICTGRSIIRAVYSDSLPIPHSECSLCKSIIYSILSSIILSLNKDRK